LLIGASAVALSATTSRAYAFSWGDVWGGAKSFFKESALVLSGWSLVDLIYQGDQAARLLPGTIANFNDTLNQVQSTLSLVSTFVQRCNTTLTDIETFLHNLPTELSKGLDSAQAKTELGRIKGTSQNLAGYLISQGSIRTNAARIQNECERLVESMAILQELEPNPLSFAMQSASAITTWMHGYTAYNLLLKPEARGPSPWAHSFATANVSLLHQAVTTFTEQLAKAQAFDDNQPKALNPGIIFSFDQSRSTFEKTDIQFQWLYTVPIPAGFYCTFVPSSAPTDTAFAALYSAQQAKPAGGTLAYLTGGSSRQFWTSGPQGLFESPTIVIPPGSELSTYVNALDRVQRLPLVESTTIKPVLDMTSDLDEFARAVDNYLVNGDSGHWTDLTRW
jgi:hypothetical protein